MPKTKYQFLDMDRNDLRREREATAQEIDTIARDYKAEDKVDSRFVLKTW